MSVDFNQAKRMVARRPVESWITVRRTAPVAVEVASPTPTPDFSNRKESEGPCRTARLARRRAAWLELGAIAQEKDLAIF